MSTREIRPWKSCTVFALIAAIGLSGAHAMGADGLTSLRSSCGPQETITRLEAAVRDRGMTVFAHIDHTAGAAKVGMALRRTEVVLFGNAKGGTPLMQAAQTIGIDLPLKALVWQDEAGATWLSYNDPVWLAERHGVGPQGQAAVDRMTAVLHEVAAAATTAAP